MGVIDRVLGIPYQTIAQKMRVDPIMSHTWSLSVATRLSVLLEQINPDKRYTFLVPSNHAWEKAKRDFSTIFASLIDINNPEFPTNVLRRHLIIYERDFTIEELGEKSSADDSDSSNRGRRPQVHQAGEE